MQSMININVRVQFLGPGDSRSTTPAHRLVSRFSRHAIFPTPMPCAGLPLSTKSPCAHTQPGGFALDLALAQPSAARLHTVTVTCSLEVVVYLCSCFGFYYYTSFRSCSFLAYGYRALLSLNPFASYPFKFPLVSQAFTGLSYL